MEALGLEDMAGAAEAAVDRWRGRVDGAEVFVLRQTGRSVSAERDRIVRASASADMGAGARVVVRGRLGFSYCTDLAELDATIERAAALAPLGREVGAAFPRVSARRVAGLRSHRVERMSADDLRDTVASMLGRAREMDPEVSVVSAGAGASLEEVAIANTSGPVRAYAGTSLSAGMSTLFRTDPPATGFDHASSRNDDVDPVRIAEEAVTMAQRSRRPVKRKAGVQPIVLRPEPLSEVLEFTLFPALDAERAMEGRSVLSGLVGGQVASPAVSISDRQDMPSGCGASPFDDEGVRSGTLLLIEAGALVNHLHTHSTASRYGAARTGSALRCERWGSSRSYRASPSAAARNAWIEATAGCEDAVAGVDDGVCVVAVMGAHTANPVSGDFSVNTNIAFEISDGEVGRALKPMMLSGNVMDLLRGITAVGSDHRFLAGSMSGLGGYFPSVALEGLTLTS